MSSALPLGQSDDVTRDVERSRATAAIPAKTVSHVARRGRLQKGLKLRGEWGIRIPKMVDRAGFGEIFQARREHRGFQRLAFQQLERQSVIAFSLYQARQFSYLCRASKNAILVWYNCVIFNKADHTKERDPRVIL